MSTQHYAFSVQAFVNVVEQCEGDDYEFILRESSTGEIIDDVRTFRSEVGVLYTDGFNRRVLQKAFDDADVAYAPLFDARVHVFVGEHHPLAGAHAAGARRPGATSRATRSSRARRTRSTIPRSRSATCRTRATSASPTAARSRTC